MERPARAVDVGITGYLPDFPWLSITANYQQFFGEMIEVSTGNDPLKDPYQLDVALNYQPVPLLTFNAGYSREKGGEKGLTVGASVTYVFGVPFEKQIDPGEVGVSKSLDVQLFKLVERDHNIRLEYRKKEPAFIARFTQSQYVVMEGSDNNLSSWLILSNPTEVSSIRYSGTAITGVPAGSGVIQRDQIDYFHAPAYQRQTSADSNQYQLTGVVTLKNGQVISTPPAAITIKPSETIASLVQRGSPVEPDGEAFILVTAMVEDADHHPLAGQTVSFSQIPNITITDEGSSTTDTNGQVTKKVTCSKAGTYTVVAEFHEQSRSVDVVFSDRPSPPPGDLSDAYSSMAASGSPALADGTAPVTVTVTLKNDDDNPVSGQTVTFPEVLELTITPQNTTTDEHGQVTALVTSSKSGIYSVTAVSNDQSRSVDLVFKANSATADISNSHSTVIINKDSAIADGADTAFIAATLKDAYGNPVSGEVVTFPDVQGLTIFKPVKTTDENGQVFADITSTVAGTYTVSAEYGGKTRPATVTFTANTATADITNDYSSLEETGSPAVADGISTISVTATLKDADGNPVAGQAIHFPEVVGITISESSGMTDDNGQVVTDVTSTLAGNYTVQTVYGGKSRSLDITFIANAATADITNTHSSVTETHSPALADATDAVTVTATLMDADGNPVSGETITFPAVADLRIVEQTATTDEQGQAVAKVTSTVAGVYTVAAEYKGKTRAVDISFIANPATADITNSHSTVTEVGSPSLADGNAVIEVTVALKDAYGNPVANQMVTFPEVVGLKIAEQALTTDAAGQVRVNVTSTVAGTYSLGAEYQGKSRSVQVIFIANPATADITNSHSSVTETSSPALADGNAIVTVTATLKDADGNPVPDQEVAFPAVSGLTITEQSSTTNTDGQVIASVTSKMAGTYSVAAEYRGKSRAVEVVFNANPATADITNDYSTFTATGSPALADGSAVITVTATLKDADGNPVPNQAVTFPAVTGLSITEQNGVTNDDGKVFVGVTSFTAGTYPVSVEHNGKSRTVNIIFTANAATAEITNDDSSVTEKGSPAIADGHAPVAITVVLKDAYGNPVPDQEIVFPAVTGLTMSYPDNKTNADGQVIASFTSTDAGEYSVAAEYKGQVRPVTISFTANPATADITNEYSNGCSL